MSRYEFEPYTPTSKTTCPSCGKRKEFTRLIDVETGELLPPDYGMCNRLIKCGYKKFPEFEEEIETTGVKVEPKTDDGTYNTLPFNMVDKSLVECQFQDNLSVYLISLFGEKAKNSLRKYKVACSNYFGGNSTIFWQITQDEVRGGKIIKYSKYGKRIREPYPHVTWVHSKMKIEYKLNQCLFGEFLLNEYPNKPVAIVESEKTSLLCDIVNKKYVWLSCTQLNGLNEEKLRVLQGREVTFFPDKGKAFHIWKNKIKYINLDFDYKISDFMEKQNDFEDGDDLGDFIIHMIKNKIFKLTAKNLAA